MTAFFNWLTGKKVYITAIVGIIVILINHFIGTIPGTGGDDMNWLNDIWALLLVIFGRHTVAQVQDQLAKK